ncbi:hypothetical protein [Duganella qianjiadongensis]|uniref:Uncharacterized protein n=1 Tax=Duganella qianjiadongensis TaxID=2692176 RepID=A0ABW9VJK8_9BURK|nr:hypothetical protein [Duganella qianjiadongensis]MYM39656.1 hypothetical protein [Duganella qianjiadongensis]
MDETQYTDQLDLAAYGFVPETYDVGPTNDGTYNVPTAAQPNNQPWDAAGGTLGQYSTKDVIGLLRDGIGIWSQNKRNNQFLDYQRYEATQGGVFTQGRPVGTRATVTAQASGNPTMLILLIGGALLLLRK